MNEMPMKLGRFVFALAFVGAPAMAAPPVKVELCHVAKGKTIEVIQSQVDSHLAHGDYLGRASGSMAVRMIRTRPRRVSADAARRMMTRTATAPMTRGP